MSFFQYHHANLIVKTEGKWNQGKQKVPLIREWTLE